MNYSLEEEDDSRRRSSAESQSSSGTANSHRSSAAATTTQPKRKIRPSTAPIKNVKPRHSSSTSTPSHRASTAPPSGMKKNNKVDDDDASSPSNDIRVVARLRPLSTKEKNEHSNESIRAHTHSSSIAVADVNNNNNNNNGGGNSRKFEFDAVFPPNSTQEQVYQKTCGDMISKSIFRGFNATILAYGQTGSGKTYTMGTDYSGGGGGGGGGGDNSSGKPFAPTSNNNKNERSLLAPPAKSEGVIGRAVHDLFSTRNSIPNGHDRVKVEMSYLEIYNEQAIDLLSSDDNDSSADASLLLQVRDSKTEGVVVQNLNSFIVNSPNEVAVLMERAASKRATGSTQMNSVSSRSHAICTLTVTIAPLSVSGGGGSLLSTNKNETSSSSSSPRDHNAMRAKLTLVDLAGSERIKRTGAEGARMKEGININKGLFVLGQVVSALSELGQSGKTSRSAGNTSHIPYRDSKLTRLLQDSLGGNSRTVMIACISPANSNVEESTNTLRYAERTRNIKNSAIRNVVSTGLSASEAAALRRENQQLKLELAQMETKMHMTQSSGSFTHPSGMPSLENSQDIALVAKLQAQCTSFLAEIAILKEKGQNHASEVLEAAERADKWQMKTESILHMASEQGIVLPESMKENNVDLVSQLRTELNDCKSELAEARTDAAVARATAGVIISGKCDFDDIDEMKSNVEDMINEDGEDENDDDDGKEQLTTELSAVSNLIEQKEKMVAQMTKERVCRDNLQHHLENSLKLLQTEVESLTSERDGLLTNMSSSNEHRRKGKPDDPTTKKLRNELTRLGDRIKELNQKANEHKRSIQMKEEAERRCEKLMTEIAEDKKRRASLQKKLKETSVEMRAEKKVAHQKALKMMKDTQKLKIEMSKIKMAAEKQATVLKRKIDQHAAKDKARRDLENKRRCAAKMRLASAMADNSNVKESRKSELASWVDSELEFCVIDSQIKETKSSLESALAQRKELRNISTDADVNAELEQIESTIRLLKQTVHRLESTAKKAFPSADGMKSSSHSSFSFLDTDTFRALSKNDAKYVLSYIFDTCSSVKKELSAIESTQETSTKAAVDAAIAKEKQLYNKEVMKLKMEHAEVMLNHLETTQGAVTSSITLKMGPKFKSQVDDVLGSYVQSCSTAGNVLKSDLHEMKQSQEGMQKMMEDIALASKKPKAKKKAVAKSSYESEEEEEEMITDESFQEDFGEDSDYEPTPAKSKRRGGGKKAIAAAAPPTPLFGEEFIIDEQFINDDLQSMRVQSLKKVCKHLGVTATGKKVDILDRIRASYQSNAALSSPSSHGTSSQHEENQHEPFGSTRKQVNFEFDADTKPSSETLSSPSLKRKLEKENSDENPKTPSKRPPRVQSIGRSPIRPGLSPMRHSGSNNSTPLHLRQTASSKRRRMSSMTVDQRPSAITTSAKKRQRQKMNESVALALKGISEDVSS